VAAGELGLGAVRLAGFGSHRLSARRSLAAGETLEVRVARDLA
jgi:hypothetical protein